MCVTLSSDRECCSRSVLSHLICDSIGPIPLFPHKQTYLNVELDTARMYSAGVSEAYVGKIMQSESNVDNALKVATKANPWGSDGLTKSSVARQMAESLKEMNLPSIDLFYLHAPDVRTPIEETLEAVQELYKQGLFKRFGLSNFAAWQVQYSPALTFN